MLKLPCPGFKAGRVLLNQRDAIKQKAPLTTQIYMKKSFFSYLSIVVLLGAVFFSSCEQLDIDDEISSAEVQSMGDAKHEINYSVSLKSAKFLIKSTEQNNEIRSIEPLVWDGDTLMYIFNFEEGWQVVSGDKRTEPILASDETGSLSIDGLDNPGVATWLSDRADEILFLKKNNPKVEYKDIELWVLIDKATHLTDESLQTYREKYDAIYSTDQQTSQLKSASLRPVPDGYRWEKRLISITSSPWTTSSQKGPLLQTKWGQGTPWNSNVPYVLVDGKWDKCATGCVAVAVSQILYHSHYNLSKPNGLYHDVSCTGQVWDSKNYSVSFSRKNYDSNSGRWDFMPTRRAGYWPDYNTPNASLVGDLMADVGNRVKMKYGEQSSASTEDEAIPTFKSFGINCSKADYNYSTVYSNLSKNSPVLVTAYAKKERKGVWPFRRTVYSDGHAWVIDGYRKKQRTTTYTYEWELVRDDAYLNPYDPYSPYFMDDLPIDEIIYPGKRDVTTSTTTTTYLLMNWGWNGSYDYSEYSVSSTIWNADKYNFQYKKRMFYNFN